MAITGTTDLGEGHLLISVDHNPEVVATDASLGDFILEESTGDWWHKDDTGVNTNVSQVLTGDFDDPDAIHDNVDGEINAITSKATAVGADILLIEDSAATNAKKKMLVSGLRLTESQITDLTHTDADAIHDNVANEITAITEKLVPIGNDEILIEDSEAAGVKKSVKISNLPVAGQTVATLTTTDGAFNTIATIALTDDTVYYLNAWGQGRRTDSADRIMFRREAGVYRESAGSAIRLGPGGTPFTRRSDPQYRVRITVSGNNALIEVRGDTGHTINWKVTYEITSVA